MDEPDGLKHVYAAPALKRFMDARASGKASKDELEQLSKAALAEQSALAAIDAQCPNGKSLNQFLRDNNLTTPRGNCGRAASSPCGLTHVHECKIHNHH